jgi:hypothetical protein
MLQLIRWHGRAEMSGRDACMAYGANTSLWGPCMVYRPVHSGAMQHTSAVVY